MPNFKKDRSKFTMKGFSPFNMGTPYETPMKKPLVGNQSKLPPELKEKILATPMKKYGKTPMKKHGKTPYKQGMLKPMPANWKGTKEEWLKKQGEINKEFIKMRQNTSKNIEKRKKDKSYKKYSDLAKFDDDKG